MTCKTFQIDEHKFDLEYVDDMANLQLSFPSNSYRSINFSVFANLSSDNVKIFINKQTVRLSNVNGASSRKIFVVQTNH